MQNSKSTIENQPEETEKEREEAQFRRMTDTPIAKLVLQLGLPTTVSMLITNIYNMADSKFVGNLGTSANGAISVVLALMAIIQAFGFMFGHGAGSNIGRLLGAHEKEKARNYSATSFYLGLATGFAILVFGLLFQDDFMYLLGSTDTILPYAKEYSTYILIAAPLMVVSCVMNNILRYEGKASFAMIGLVSGGVLNIFGDWLLTVVIPLGVTGAGISTAVSQLVSAVILSIPFIRGKVQSSLNPRYLSGDIKLIFSILSIGFPSLLRQGLNSVSTTILNHVCQPYGDAAIAAMGNVAKVMGALFCVGLGIGQGFQPVCGFNFGAKKYKRVKESFWFTLKFGFGLLTFMAALGLCFAEPVIRFFNDDPEVVRIGALAMRFQSASLISLSFTVMGNMLFQSAGKSGRASFLATARSGLFFIPVLLLFSKAFGLLGIQLSQAVADVLAACVTMPIVMAFLKKLPDENSDEEKTVGSPAAE